MFNWAFDYSHIIIKYAWLVHVIFKTNFYNNNCSSKQGPTISHSIAQVLMTLLVTTLSKSMQRIRSVIQYHNLFIALSSISCDAC